MAYDASLGDHGSKSDSSSSAVADGVQGAGSNNVSLEREDTHENGFGHSRDGSSSSAGAGGAGGDSGDDSTDSNNNDHEEAALAELFVVLSKELDNIYEPVLGGDKELTCDGCCSRGPHKFSDCIVKQMPPKDVDMQEIRMKCTWVTMNATLPHNHLRNLLYFWYATTVFCHTHAGTRKPLPRCLVAAIRALFPNLAGTPYRGSKVRAGRNNVSLEREP